MRKLRADAVIALVLLGAGGFVLNDLLRTEGSGAFVKNTTLPIALVVFLMLLSLVLLAQAMLRQPPADMATPDGEGDGTAISAAERRHLVRVAATIVWIILYVLALPWFGYLASSIVFLAGASLIYGNRNYLLVAALSAIIPTALLFFFERFMVVLLPSARLFGQ